MTDETYTEALERYRDLISGYPDVEVKGKANPYTSMNGNMFSFLDKEGLLCMRLSKPDLEAFVEEHQTEPVIQYGSVLKEYVAIPEGVASDAARLRELFDKCLGYVRSLPAKPTKKR